MRVPERGAGAFFHSKGITHNPTQGYTPEQNGAAERLNRTLVDKACTMLIAANLHKDLWAEALATANLVAPTAGAAVTPYQAFYSDRPNVSKLRTYGCTVYASILDARRG